MKFIKSFEDLTLKDVPLVGGKNASLGEMIRTLSRRGITVPHGFAITAEAYWHYISANDLLRPMEELMSKIKNMRDVSSVQEVGSQIRALILQGKTPDDLAREIVQAYTILSQRYDQEMIDVAVRSSATAEDLPTASFAGQQETYLNIRGTEQLLDNFKKCVASLFTDRAIVYRAEHGFDHFKVALSVGVQKMVRSDLATAGVAFSLDTETGFRDAITINSSYGLGESVVKGMVEPDEFVVAKPPLKAGFSPIIKKFCGAKEEKIMCNTDKSGTHIVPVKLEEQQHFSLSDEEILHIARMILIIEDHYSDEKDAWSPMDVEWAKDGVDGRIYIVQARPETVHSVASNDNILRYTLHENDKSQLKTLVTGQSIGQKIVAGPVRIVTNVHESDSVQRGDILVTDMTDPDWVPAMRRAAGIITNRGGRTCHAAIVSRELGIPAIVGAHDATLVLHDDQMITMDCSRGETGSVYEGQIPFEVNEIALERIPELPVRVMLNLANPGSAFSNSFLPVDGVGLARMEFIITNNIRVHPMALLYPEKVLDENVRKQIAEITAAYPDGKTFFIETLAQGVGMIAAAFYPRPVIVRLSDFKTNEYRNLLGGKYFEPKEENPMLGFRGAIRYDHAMYREAFLLECAALERARDHMGLRNIKVMVPFVRTVPEAERVLALMGQHGLVRGEHGLEFVMMIEVPSNAILIEQFCPIFDGFSIGSNDLTQLTLGIDRDSGLLATSFDERDPAVIAMMRMAINGANECGKYIGICGQAPSDYPELAQILIDEGISSLSLNADAVIPFLMRYV